MRETRTSGSMRERESGGHWPRPFIPCFLSLLYFRKIFPFFYLSTEKIFAILLTPLF
jgi:hypothetical protein